MAVKFCQIKKKLSKKRPQSSKLEIWYVNEGQKPVKFYQISVKFCQIVKNAFLSNFYFKKYVYLTKIDKIRQF